MEKGQQAKVVNSVFGIQNKLNRSINYMKKSISIIILSIVIVCSLLSGCGDKHTAIIMKNAKDFTLTQEISESFKLERVKNKVDFWAHLYKGS